MASRKKLRERSDATLGDILDNPGRIVSPSDLASAGVVGSYSTIKSWVDKGWLPEPHRLPNGQKYWTGGEIGDALGHRPLDDDAKSSGTSDPQVADDAEAVEANAAKKAANADEETAAEEEAA
jgi:hypothetical protein